MKFKLSIWLVLLLILLSKTILGENLKEAKYYIQMDNKKVNCQLCPRRCVIPEGGRGYCTVRKNIKGKLYSLVYGKPVSIAVDPIEKKPVFHMLPGSLSFSFATAGCNLRCVHCQNWQIAQVLPEDLKSYDLSPEQIVDMALKSGSKSIAYTYNEPTVFYEYMLDCAKLARKKGLKNVWVTCGYINPDPLRELCQYLDVGRVDLKGFSDEFYKKIAGAELAPVLRTLKILKEEKVWIEIINLIIPGYNDDIREIKEMCLWIKNNLGTDYPLYFSRFHPEHKLRMVPPTPVETLEKARKTAMDVGLKYVYIGNVSGHAGENTYCSKCKKILVHRVGYSILENNIKDSMCPFCGQKIPGLWK